MTARGQQGGPRQPANPAPVSNPGSGARTDGGAGSKSQPLRVPSGGAYGERKAAIAQQQGAPIPDATSPGGGSPQGGRPMGGGGAGPLAGGAFGPTQRPMESPSAGLGPNQDSIASNPQQALRVLYAKFPHPAIARLIDFSVDGGAPS